MDEGPDATTEGRPSAFSAWLIERRGGGRTVYAVARDSGVDAGVIYRAERGATFPTADTLRALCAFYGADFDEGHELLLAAKADHERWKEWRR